jgi:hypothetical protein
VIQAAGAVGAVDHQAGVLEHLQVLGHCGAADRQLTRQLADRERTAREALEDRPARRVAEGGQAVGSVSRH